MLRKLIAPLTVVSFEQMDKDEDHYMNELKISRSMPKLTPGRTVDDLSSQEQRDYLANLRDFSFYIEQKILKDNESESDCCQSSSCNNENTEELQSSASKGDNNHDGSQIEKETSSNVKGEHTTMWNHDRLQESGKRKRSLKLRRSKEKVKVETFTDIESSFEEITSAQKDKYENKSYVGVSSKQKSINNIMPISSESDSVENDHNGPSTQSQAGRSKRNIVEVETFNTRNITRVANEIKESASKIKLTVKETMTLTTSRASYHELSQINEDLKELLGRMKRIQQHVKDK